MTEKRIIKSSESKEAIRHVLALTVIDRSTLGPDGAILPSTRILLCVRAPETNDTHPNVVSVPTMRITQTESMHFDKNLKSTMGIDSRYLDRAVKKLLSQKLGVQKTSNHNIIAKLSYLEEGVVRHDNLPETDTRRVEDTKMYNADVLIDDVKIFPDQTKDYSKIWWATVGDFLNMMDGKDVTKVGISAFDAIRGICAQGLCLSSTEENLRRKLF